MLGKGFAFVGSQYNLEVAGQDYYLDLLFYHLQLRCFVVVELKIEEFQPEFAGKINFYLSAVDDLLRHADDAPTIGIILCQGKNAVVVEYALRDSVKPMGVAEYTLSQALPAPLQGALPTAEDLAREFPLMSLVKLRIDIERQLRALAEDTGVVSGRPMGHNELVKASEGVRQLPSTAEFMRIVNSLHDAAHGVALMTAPHLDHLDFCIQKQGLTSVALVRHRSGWPRGLERIAGCYRCMAAGGTCKGALLSNSGFEGVSLC